MNRSLLLVMVSAGLPLFPQSPPVIQNELASACDFPTPQAIASLKYSVELDRSVYLPGEPVRMRLRLANRGTTAVDARKLIAAGAHRINYARVDGEHGQGEELRWRKVEPMFGGPCTAGNAGPTGVKYTQLLNPGDMLELDLSVLEPPPSVDFSGIGIGLAPTDAGEYLVRASFWELPAPDVRFRVEEATLVAEEAQREDGMVVARAIQLRTEDGVTYLAVTPEEATNPYSDYRNVVGLPFRNRLHYVRVAESKVGFRNVKVERRAADQTMRVTWSEGEGVPQTVLLDRMRRVKPR